MLRVLREHENHRHGRLCASTPAEDAMLVAIRLLSGPQSRASASTPLNAQDFDRNHTIWNARLVLDHWTARTISTQAPVLRLGDADIAH